MSATEISDDLGPLVSDALQDARAEALPALSASEQRVLRLIATAHEDEKRAQNELLRLLGNGSVENIINILSNDTKRKWHFGAMKGAFLVRGNKKESLTALAELPEALRDMKLIGDRVNDLNKAHRQALEKEEREFFEERARARSQGRDEPTREQYMDRRRKRR